MGKKHVIFAILIILIIIVLIIAAKLQYKSIINNRRYARIRMTKNDILYNNIIGDTNNDLVKTLTKNLTKKPKRTMHEDILLGNIWKHVMHDDEIANSYYDEAMIKDDNDAPFNDYYILLDYAITEPNNDNVQNIQEKLLKPNKDVERIKQLDERKEITSDPQNVHDSNVNLMMKNDYQFIKSFLDKDVATHDDYIKLRALCKGKIKDSYFTAHEYYTTFELFGDTESIVFTNIWKYINHPKQVNRDSLVIAFFESANDAFEENKYGEGLVCTHGRIAKLMGSLAHSDINGLGKYKTDQMIRSECLSTAATIRDKRLSNSSKEVIDSYNNSEQTEDVKNLTKDILQEIHDEIYKQYQGYNPVKLDTIYREIEAFI